MNRTNTATITTRRWWKTAFNMAQAGKFHRSIVRLSVAATCSGGTTPAIGGEESSPTAVGSGRRTAERRTDDYASRLRREARRVTGPRRAILEVLRRSPHPITNREILAAMPKGNCALATIYR